MKLKVKHRKKLSQLPHRGSALGNDESLQIPSDDDGKIIFLYKESIPLWLIEELNQRFRCNKDRGSKCGQNCPA